MHAWAIPATQPTAVVVNIQGKNISFIHGLQGFFVAGWRGFSGLQRFVLQICSDKTDRASSVCLAALAKAMWAALRAFRPASATASTSRKSLSVTSAIKSS